MKAYLVHGFNVSDGGAGSVDKLVPEVQAAGFEAVEFKYGWTGLLGVRFLNKRRARRLRELAGDEPAVGIGHSNGCELLYEAAKMGAPFYRLVFLNPALDNGVSFPAQVEAVGVFHTPAEKATRLAKWLVFHPWGDMGARGYQGRDPRVVNRNMLSGERWTRQARFTLYGFKTEYAVRSHSGIFAMPAAGYWLPLVAGVAAQELRI